MQGSLPIARPCVHLRSGTAGPLTGALCGRPQQQQWRREQRRRATSGNGATTTGTSPPPSSVEDRKSQEYNQAMNRAMQWGKNPFEYQPSRGLYYHEISSSVLCGTQPRSAADVTALHQQGVTHILNLQTDKDMQHWGTNVEELQRQCAKLGMYHIRRAARDFDPHSLRRTLPGAVSVVRHALSHSNQNRVYVHCTAGLGRAPAVCIAYMYWFLEHDLDQAYKHLTDIRPCGPKRDAIRGATYDLLSGAPAEQFERLGKDAWASLSQEDKFALQWRVLKS